MPNLWKDELRRRPRLYNGSRGKRMKKLKAIHLYEWDADINNLGKGKVGETIEYEVQPFLSIPENSYKKKGQPRHKVAYLKEDIIALIEEMKNEKVGGLDRPLQYKHALSNLLSNLRNQLVNK
jgi:hypothetical protein